MSEAPQWSAEQAGVHSDALVIELTKPEGRPWVATGLLWFLNEVLAGVGLMLLADGPRLFLALASKVDVPDDVYQDRASRFVAVLRAFDLHDVAEALLAESGNVVP